MAEQDNKAEVNESEVLEARVGGEVPDLDIEIEDDTPPEDRGRQPLPKEVVEELEKDELDEYSSNVKQKLLQMKKVWHDERREKERAFREQQEAIAFAQKMFEENKRLKTTLSQGEITLIDTYKNAAQLEMEMAKRAYKEAYDTGDTDQIVEAQEKLAAANYKMQQIQGYVPSLQTTSTDVDISQVPVQAPRLDQKTLAWRERNKWFGQDEEMTSLALGLHQKLEKRNGVSYVGTDEYWSEVDSTMRKRFPDYFGNDDEEAQKPTQRAGQKLATVVAPASRSTAPKKVRLNQSQLNIAKRLGLTPEQYAKEMVKLENQNV